MLCRFALYIEQTLSFAFSGILEHALSLPWDAIFASIAKFHIISYHKLEVCASAKLAGYRKIPENAAGWRFSKDFGTCPDSICHFHTQKRLERAPAFYHDTLECALSFRVLI
jgi:hypothetical protein